VGILGTGQDDGDDDALRGYLSSVAATEWGTTTLHVVD
jgi:hypothetical protein